MSRRVENYTLLSAGDMSGNLTSNEVDVGFKHNVAFHLIFTGSPTGTFYVDGSLDKENWEALSFDPTNILAEGSAGSHLLDLPFVSWPYLRVRYVASSGSGSLKILFGCKG